MSRAGQCETQPCGFFSLTRELQCWVESIGSHEIGAGNNEQAGGSGRKEATLEKQRAQVAQQQGSWGAASGSGPQAHQLALYNKPGAALQALRKCRLHGCFAAHQAAVLGQHGLHHLALQLLQPQLLPLRPLQLR